MDALTDYWESRPEPSFPVQPADTLDVEAYYPRGMGRYPGTFKSFVINLKNGAIRGELRRGSGLRVAMLVLVCLVVALEEASGAVSISQESPPSGQPMPPRAIA